MRSINVYVTLDTDQSTEAYGKTVCCWTYAETSLVATDSVGREYAYPSQVTAR